MTEFHAQDARLQGIEASVVALDIVIILLRLTVLAQHAHFLGDRFTVGGFRARFAASTQILSWVKAESRGVAHGAGFPPAIFLLRKILGAMSLAGVFHHNQVVATREIEERIHVRSLSVNMHWYDRC